MRKMEPHVAGLAAAHVPEEGIVDYRQVTQAYAGLVAAAGGTIRTSARAFGCVVLLKGAATV